MFVLVILGNDTPGENIVYIYPPAQAMPRSISTLESLIPNIAI